MAKPPRQTNRVLGLGYRHRGKTGATEKGKAMDTWVDQLPQDKVEKWIAANGERALEEYYTTDPRFALWMAHVDRRVHGMVIFGCMDLEDWPYHDAYVDGVTPREAAIDVVEYNGFAVAE